MEKLWSEGGLDIIEFSILLINTTESDEICFFDKMDDKAINKSLAVNCYTPVIMSRLMIESMAWRTAQNTKIRSLIACTGGLGAEAPCH